MKKLLFSLAIVGALSACGGGGGGSPSQAGGGGGGSSPSPVTPTSAEGLWLGTTSSQRSVTTIVLNDGTFWAFYTPMNSGNFIAGAIQGTGASVNGSFSSSDAKDFNFEGSGVNGAVLSGSYVAKKSLNGTISYPALNQSITFASTYDPAYEATPSLTTVSGNFTGNAAILGFAGPGTVDINSTGAVSGGITGGCGFAGTITPRAKGNAYDISVTFDGMLCALRGTTVTGIAYFDATNRRLSFVALNFSVATGLTFLGVKP